MTPPTRAPGGVGVGGDLAPATLDAGDQPSLHRLARAEPHWCPALLESSAGAAAQPRYDILLADPPEALTPEQLGFRKAFFHTLDEYPGPRATTYLSFIGGSLLYPGYEMAAGVEPRLVLPAAGDGRPTALTLWNRGSRISIGRVVTRRTRRCATVRGGSSVPPCATSSSWMARGADGRRCWIVPA